MRRSSGAPLGCMGLFFGLFALVGGALLWPMGIRPLYKSVASRSWTETPAEVTASEVERHSGSKGGSTYNVKISYDYTFRGQRYHSEHYDFETGSSSGSEEKQAIVDRFPAGARTICWVNPDDPAESVIDRSVGWWIMWGCFALVFLGAGLGGLVFVIAVTKGKRAAAAAGAIGPA